MNHPSCITVHAYFPELCSVECSCDEFEGSCLSGEDSLLCSAISGIYACIERQKSDSCDKTSQGLVRRPGNKENKDLRLVDGRLQVVGFDIAVLKKSQKFRVRKKSEKIRRISWSEVLRYLLK